MSITEIAFTGVPVTDMKRARDFYERVLGLKPSLEAAEGMLVEYSLGGSILTIGRLGEAFKPSSNGTFVALEVDDIDAEVANLEAHNVKFALGVSELPTSRFAVILDPDGNSIMIHKRKT